MHKKYFKPDLLVRSIGEISFSDLAKKGIKVFVFDIDNTLTLQDSGEIDGVKSKKLQEASRFGTVIFASNNSKERKDLASKYKIFKPRSFCHWFVFRKPFKNYFETLIRQTGLKPKETAMIGDKYFFDINPAKKVGMFGILVNPVGKDLWGDRFLNIRKKENQVLKREFDLKRPQ